MLNPDLPNFFIIGASKSGTTTLYDVLRQHPQIYFSFAKEIQFFSHDEYFGKGLAWYAETFFKNATHFPARGDASTHYLFWSEKVVPRIKESFGENPLKFIAIFRDPVQRAYSWYWHLRREGKESLSFEDALSAEDERYAAHWEELFTHGMQRYGYYRGGCYATQLETYLETFSRGNFLFLLHEDLKKDFPNAISSILAFLEVGQIELNPSRSNPAAVSRSRRLQNFLLRPSGPLHRMIRIFTHRLPHNIRYQLKMSALEMNLREETYPPMEKATERRLRLRYREEVERLEKIIGRDLSHWICD
jgi:hypothetical protein